MKTRNLKLRKQFLPFSFASVLHKYQYNLNLGDIVAGLIFSKESHGYLVDIGDAKAAFLPRDEISMIDKTTIHFRSIQEFFILSYNDRLSQLILSTRRLEYLRIWKRIRQLYEEDIIIYSSIIGQNSGGLLISFYGIQGFLPNSHITNLNFKKAMINTTIPLKFLTINEELNRLVVSHRRAILSLSDLIVGHIINTKIVRIKNYGVLVKAHNIRALLHTSEIPNASICINNTDTFFEINKNLKVMVIHVNEIQGRVSVSIKQLSS